MGNQGWYFSTHFYEWQNAVLTGLAWEVDQYNVLSLLPTISVIGSDVAPANLRLEDGRIEYDPPAYNAPGTIPPN